MPTPVSVARQCLTEEAARSLDDAVAVASRRSHTQTTSLHAVSALLALPSSTLRDACARARNSPCSSRLQFRALELCVGVSLDRLPSSKTLDEPPISNSLMAAIKRSQANQRRHPDNFHLQQIHCNQQPASVLKVELKRFILSILDDPIVSRVLGEAGFRSCDIKIAIIHPPLLQTRKFSRTICSPIFLCNLTGPDLGRPGFSCQFPGLEDGDDSSRRIAEALMKRNGKRKNLLLLGVCASDALSKFIERVNIDSGVLPSEIAGLSLISIEKEIIEFVSEGGRDKQKMGFEELRHKLEQCSGPGILLNIGELKALMDENAFDDAVSYLVSKLTALLEGFREKLWLIGAAARYETYSKFLGQFPAIEKDWDLHVLPITSSRTPIDCFGSKSGLMGGSFVPFGGFFSSPSDFKNPLSNINQSITRCHLCTAKYEQEVASMLKMGSKISVSDKYSEKLPSWLQMTQLDRGLRLDAAKTKNDGTTLNSNISGLQKKWNDICQQLHHAQPFSKFDISSNRPETSYAEGFQCVADMKEGSCSSSCSKDSSLNENRFANLGLGAHIDSQNVLPAQHNMLIPFALEAKNVNNHPKQIKGASINQQKEKDGPWFTSFTPSNMSLPSNHTSSSSISPVTTDLGLATLSSSSSQLPNTSKSNEHKEYFQRFSRSNFAEFGISEGTSHQIIQSSSHSIALLGEQFDSKDYKSIRKALIEKVGWQEEAICTISQAISRCRAGFGRHCGSTARGDIWLTFIGPDKVGKKRIASILAETVFGSQENFVSVDLSFHDGISPSNSVFECQESNDYDVKFRGKTVIDYIAMELRKKPPSVVLLENVDKCDFQAQTSLCQALRTGKFSDSIGREISTKNMIFVTTSKIAMGYMNFLPRKKVIRFSEESILGAKSWQMQIIIQHASEHVSRSNEINVKISRKITSNLSSMNKRKLDGTTDSAELDFNYEAKKRAHKDLGSSLDLNLPVEETEESTNSGNFDSDPISKNSQAWLEDFFDKVDEKVLLKPFDFDALAERIVRQISKQFQKAFGSDIFLEIDEEVMVQILAASWSSDVSTAMEDWIERVLGRAFTEARHKYHVNIQNVVKLATCEGILVEDRAPGICLPSRINVETYFLAY